MARGGRREGQRGRRSTDDDFRRGPRPAAPLRGGVGKDESPTNDLHRTPRLPDNDRMLYSIGATWNVSPALSIDAAYQRIEIDSPKIALPVDAGSGNSSTLVGSFDGYANLFGVSMQYRF